MGESERERETKVSPSILSQQVASLSWSIIVHVALVPGDNVVDKTTNQGIDQESNTDHAGDKDDGDVGTLFNADAEEQPRGGKQNTQTRMWVV